MACAEPKWRNWQTRRTQNPVAFGPCGFDSHLRHRLGRDEGDYGLLDRTRHVHRWLPCRLRIRGEPLYCAETSGRSLRSAGLVAGNRQDPWPERPALVRPLAADPARNAAAPGVVPPRRAAARPGAARMGAQPDRLGLRSGGPG